MNPRGRVGESLEMKIGNNFWVWMNWIELMDGGREGGELGAWGKETRAFRYTHAGKWWGVGRLSKLFCLKSKVWSLFSLSLCLLYTPHSHQTTLRLTTCLSPRPVFRFLISFCWKYGDGGVVRTGRSLTESGLANADVSLSEVHVFFLSRCNCA